LTAGLVVSLLVAVCGSAQISESEAAAKEARDRAVIAAPVSEWRKSPLVNAPYVPLTVKDKGRMFGWRVVQPAGFARSAFTAALAQWLDTPPEWGQGMAGYGRRYGHRIGNRAVESGIGFGVSSVLRQDPRYFRNPGGGTGGRLWNAVSQVAVTRTDSGGKTFSTWRFAGNYGGQFVSNTWRPERQRTFGNTMVRGSLSIAFDAAANVFKEFWPDIRRRVLKR
jgi:hypothetical protein